jgi:DNA-3-methyladenine glycosylase II
MAHNRRFRLSIPVDRPRLMSSSNTVEYVPEFKAGLEHVIDIDPTLAPLIERSQFPSYFKGGEESKRSSFESLASGIISQQVSGSAANAIRKKFMRLFQDPETPDDQLLFPDPDQVLLKTAEDLRSAGLSARKGEYISGLANAFASGELSDQILTTLDDDDVVDKLVSLKGIGRK